MKVSLIHVRVREASNLVPPVGVLSIAAVLRAAGFDVLVLDADPQMEDVVERVISFSPRVVGLGFMTPACSRAQGLLRDLRRRLPSTVFCAGGVHATVFPERVVSEFGLDFAVVGEGEETMREVCGRIRDGRPCSDVEGLCLRDGGGAFLTPSRPLIEDLDALPPPATDLVDYERYLVPPGLFRGRATDRVAAVLTSRGCRSRCIYCGSRNVFRGVVRFRSVPSVVAEVDGLLRAHQIRGVFLLDECFTAARGRALQLGREMGARRLPWACQTKVTMVDRELLASFRRDGCIEVNFGVESGSPRILSMLRKGITPEAAVRAFDWCRELGLRATANFIVGSPGETRADLRLTYALARRLRASYTVFHVATPFPGTELYDLALRNGWMAEPHSFDERWMHRAGGQPLLEAGLPTSVVRRTRARFQNRFFLRNYANRDNFRWGLRYAAWLLRHPGVATQAAANWLRDGRLDSALETVVAESCAAGGIEGGAGLRP